MAWGSCYTPDFRVASILGASTGTTAVANRRLVENLVGSPTFVVDTIDTGRYGLRMSHNASQQSVAIATMVSGGRYLGLLARVKVTALTTNCLLMWGIASTTSQNIHLRVNASTGLLAYSFDNGGSFTNSGTALSAGTVYAIEMFIDWNTGTTHTLKVRVDGTEVINVTGGTAIVTSGNFPANFGELAASASMVVDYADMATYNDVAEYGAVGADWRVFGLEPTADGTHNFTQGTPDDFQTDASVDVGSSTTTWQSVDDAPGAAPDTTAFLKQTVSRTTSYLEWVLNTAPSSGYDDPLLVCLAAAQHPVASSTSTNNIAFRLNAGGNVSAEATVDHSLTANTLEYSKHHYTTRPGGAAWTIADVTSTPLRARWGYSTDIVPVPAVDAVMAFVLVPATAVSNQTVSPDAATASASGLVPIPDLKVGPAAATASASAPLPKAPSITPAAATASASSPVAVPKIGITVPLATASANGPPPTINVGQMVSPPAATASASGPVPTIALQVPSAASTASASSLEPTVTAAGGGGAATYVGQLFSAPITSVVSSTTISGNTSVAVAAGDTVFFVLNARGGTTTAQWVQLSGLPGDAVFEGNTSGDIGTLQTSNGGSPAGAIIRVYLPTGMSSGTTITGTWLQSATRKAMDGIVWTGVADANNQGHQVSTGSGGTSLGAGTTGATTTTGGVHIAHWSINSTAGTITYTPGADTEGTMTERSEVVVGASNFNYLYAEDNPVTAAHAGGETALVTVGGTGSPATWVSEQGIWDGGGVSNKTVSPPAATASASGLVPVPQLSVPPAAATASASSLTPTPQLRVSPVAATANASGLAPVPQLRVSPAAATASASAPIPLLGPRIPPASATSSASAPIPVPQLRVSIPTRGATVFGYTNQAGGDIQQPNAERLLGRTFNGLRQNQNQTVSGWTFASAEYALGRKLTYRSIELNTGVWADVTAGTHDSEFLAIASNLAATGLWSPSNPAYICFHHEATTDANLAFGNGQDYINAWRHIRDLWDTNGYTVLKKDGSANGGPILMVLCHFHRAYTNTLWDASTETPPAGRAHADFDPDGGSSPAPGGTSYYEGLGNSSYNSIQTPGTLKYGTDAANMHSDMVVQAAARGKFTFIGEFGCEDGTTTTDHTNKADWLDSCRVYFSNLTGTQQTCRALLCTIKASAENYNVDSSPQALAAFQRLAQAPNFDPDYAGAFGMLPTLPTSVPTATSASSALVPNVFTGQTVAPPAATASASGLVPVPQLRVLPAAATASAPSLAPTVGTNPVVSPPVATTAASAPVPTVQLSVPPGASTASASALVPSVQLRVSPAAATANASSPTPVPQLRVSPAAATASASAPIPTVAAGQTIAPPAGTASASALVPAVQLRVPPPAATASASGPVPNVIAGQTVLPPVTTATASALAPVPQLRVLPPVATASASSPVAAPGPVYLPPAGSASAGGLTPTPQLRVLVPAASSSASALEPTVGTTAPQTVSPPVATAAASGPIPVPQLRVSPAAATASASSLTPIPQLRVPPAQATASASALVPVGAVIVSPPAATSAASALTPTPQLRVSPASATASASAIVPTVAALTGTSVFAPVAVAAASALTPALQLSVPTPIAAALATAPTPLVSLTFPVQWPPDTSPQWAADSNLQWPPDSNERW